MDKTTDAWNNMTNNFLQSWTETGTKVWQNWFDLIGLVPNNLPDNAKPELQYFTQQFKENQELFGRLLKLSFNAWTEIFPKVQSGEDWQEVVKNYTEQMRQQFDQFSTGTLKVNQDTSQLWQIYVTQMQKFNQLWLNTLTQSISPLSQTLSGNSEPWIELNNLYWNLLYEENFGSLVQSPLLGPTRELNSKILRGFDAWVHLYRATIDYQIVLSNVQVRSFEALMQELVSMAEKGKKIENWQQLQMLWSTVADDVFAKEFCDEKNLKIRGKFLNALNTYRVHQQELMELGMKMMNIPSRQEVDEMHKIIYELRKEVKSLKKSLAKSEAKQAEFAKILEQNITKEKEQKTIKTSAKNQQPPVQE